MKISSTRKRETIPELVPREEHYFSDDDEDEDESPSESNKQSIDTPNNQPFSDAKYSAA